MSSETIKHEYAFRATGVHKIFPGSTPVHAVKDVSLELEQGSFTCIVGPSGSGKSTLLRILGGLEDATAGTVEVGVDGGRVPDAAFVFQEHGIFPWMTVTENIAFGLEMAGISKGQARNASKQWIHEVGLTGFEKAYPHQLSGGMRQRIAIARAFATGSPALLMDEPLGALDAQTRTLMQEQLVRLWEQDQKTVVLVTHSIEEALLLGDEIVVMTARPGEIKETIKVPFGRPRDLATIELDPTFAQLKQDIWEILRDEVQASLKMS